MDSSTRAQRLPLRQAWPAARLLADAFLADPVMTAVWPRARGHRLLVLRLFFVIEMLIAYGRKGLVYGGYEGDRLVGVVLAFLDGERGFPWWTWAPRVLPGLVAGPFSALRALRAYNDFSGLQPPQAHVHFWQIGAEEGTRGIGMMLMRTVLDRHVDNEGRSAYLEASAPLLAQLYGLVGFEPRELCQLPSGDVLTTMWRPAREAA